MAALNHAESDIEITGVNNSKSYIVGVRARNSEGDSGWRNSPKAGPYTPPAPTPTPTPTPTPNPTPTPTPAPTPTPTPTPTEPPEAPSQVTVTRGNGTMTIEWPAVDTASGYTVLASSVRNRNWLTPGGKHQGNQPDPERRLQRAGLPRGGPGRELRREQRVPGLGRRRTPLLDETRPARLGEPHPQPPEADRQVAVGVERHQIPRHLHLGRGKELDPGPR